MLLYYIKPIISPVTGVVLSYQHVTRHITFTTIFMVCLIPSKSCDRNDGSAYLGSTELSTLKRNCCICGYHIYHSIWDRTVGEELLCKCELTDLHNRYAVAVIKDRNVIRRLFTTVGKRDGPFRC